MHTEAPQYDLPPRTPAREAEHSPCLPFNVFPHLVLGWLILGAAVVVLVPGLARQIGSRLVREELEQEVE